MVAGGGGQAGDSGSAGAFLFDSGRWYRSWGPGVASWFRGAGASGDSGRGACRFGVARCRGVRGAGRARGARRGHALGGDRHQRGCRRGPFGTAARDRLRAAAERAGGLDPGRGQDRADLRREPPSAYDACSGRGRVQRRCGGREFAGFGWAGGCRSRFVVRLSPRGRWSGRARAGGLRLRVSPGARRQCAAASRRARCAGAGARAQRRGHRRRRHQQGGASAAPGRGFHDTASAGRAGDTGCAGGRCGWFGRCGWCGWCSRFASASAGFSAAARWVCGDSDGSGARSGGAGWARYSGWWCGWARGLGRFWWAWCAAAAWCSEHSRGAALGGSALRRDDVRRPGSGWARGAWCAAAAGCPWRAARARCPRCSRCAQVAWWAWWFRCAWRSGCPG